MMSERETEFCFLTLNNGRYVFNASTINHVYLHKVQQVQITSEAQSAPNNDNFPAGSASLWRLQISVGMLPVRLLITIWKSSSMSEWNQYLD